MSCARRNEKTTATYAFKFRRCPSRVLLGKVCHFTELFLELLFIYSRFFDAWRAGDYTSAFDNLHRYYDYALQTREQIHYQYALLHMAIIQADFGCFGEAIAAINETIATARENQDMICLNFSLNWLNHLRKAHPREMRRGGHVGPSGSDRDGLLFLKSKAREAKMYPLLISSLLNEAKYCLETVILGLSPFKTKVLTKTGGIDTSCSRTCVPSISFNIPGVYQ
jgi:tetratricopeptide (TPR) repeat protein